MSSYDPFIYLKSFFVLGLVFLKYILIKFLV